MKNLRRTILKFLIIVLGTVSILAQSENKKTSPENAFLQVFWEDKPSRGGLELLFFQPVPVWQKVKVPVLLMWGDKDTVVPALESRAIIENTLKKSENQNFTTRIFPNVDHGAAVVRDDENRDFPRVELNYYEAMVEWTVSKTKS